MLPRAESFSFFGNSFVQYTFLRAGDELPLHAHPFDHGTIVMCGEVEAFGEGGQRMALKAGERVNFPAHKLHGVRALVDGAIILNVMPPTSG